MHTKRVCSEDNTLNALPLEITNFIIRERERGERERERERTFISPQNQTTHTISVIVIIRLIIIITSCGVRHNKPRPLLPPSE